MARPAESTNQSRFILLVSACIVVAALFLAREVLVPIALAVLLSFLLTPAVQWLERLRLPRIAATLIVVLIGMGILGAIGYGVGQEVKSIAENFPSYEGQLKAKFHALGSHGGFFRKVAKEAEDVTSDKAAQHPPDGRPATIPETINHFVTVPPVPPAVQPVTADHPLPVREVPAPMSPWTLLVNYSSTVLSPLANAVIVLVFVIFMLLSREDLRDRIIRLLGHGRVNLTTQAIDEASTRISRYLGALSIVNAGYALLTAIGLWCIAKMLGHGHSFPNVLVWAVLVGVLRFVPYVGIWIGAGICLLLSFALFDGYGVFFGVLILFAVLEIVVAQFIEPKWYGSSTGMSALAVLVSAVFWSWLWGPIGLLLSTPMTVILVVMGKYVPQLKFLDILLREEPVLAPPFRFYQRLIALDQEEAADLAQEYLKEKQSLQNVYEDLLIPALVMAEHDGHHERVANDQLDFVRQSVRELLDELGEQYRKMIAAAPGGQINLNAAKNNGEQTSDVKTSGQAPDSSPEHRRSLPAGRTINLLCLPARDESDELLAIMLAQLTELRGYTTFTATSATLAGEMVEMIESKQIDLVCISAMPPAAVVHARYLLKRIAARFPEIGIVTALWTSKGDPGRARERLGGSTNLPIATTLQEAQEQLDQLATAISYQSPASVR